MILAVIPHHVSITSELVPQGWSIAARADGILATRNRRAVALILEKKVGRPGQEEENPRLLVVATQTPDGSYDRLSADNQLIPSDNQYAEVTLGDDQRTPALSFTGGSLRVNYHVDLFGGPGAYDERTFTFRELGNSLYLIGYDNWVVTQRFDDVGRSYNFLTGRARISTGENCAGSDEVIARCRYKVTWKRLKVRHPISIDDIGDGWSFAPATD